MGVKQSFSSVAIGMTTTEGPVLLLYGKVFSMSNTDYGLPGLAKEIPKMRQRLSTFCLLATDNTHSSKPTVNQTPSHSNTF